MGALEFVDSLGTPQRHCYVEYSPSQQLSVVTVAAGLQELHHRVDTAVTHVRAQ